MEEATQSKGNHFAKLKWVSIAKITFLEVLDLRVAFAPYFLNRMTG